MNAQQMNGEKSIGDRITRARRVMRLKQGELAERAGMSEAYVNRLENGVVPNPKALDLGKVARAVVPEKEMADFALQALGFEDPSERRRLLFSGALSHIENNQSNPIEEEVSISISTIVGMASQLENVSGQLTQILQTPRPTTLRPALNTQVAS